MATVRIDIGDAPDAPLTRGERKKLVDRVILECMRDPAFAHLLADNLHGAGVHLPNVDGAGGRPRDWSDAALLKLLTDFTALRISGMSALEAQHQLAEKMGRGLSAKHVANRLADARKIVSPTTAGRRLRRALTKSKR